MKSRQANVLKFREEDQIPKTLDQKKKKKNEGKRKQRGKNSNEWERETLTNQ